MAATARALMTELADKSLDAMGDMDRWSHQCHAAALHLVRSGALPAGSRVARGVSKHLGGQHSWVAVANEAGVADPYARNALILDPSAWSYQEDDLAAPSVWIGRRQDYAPQGSRGPDARKGLPRPADYADIIRPDQEALQRDYMVAVQFFAQHGSLDRRGWTALTHCRVDSYPAAAIIPLMLDTPRLAPFVPIDIAGMVTDRNPGGLYF